MQPGCFQPEVKQSMKIVTLGSLAFFLLAMFALLAVFLLYPLFLYMRPPYRRSSQSLDQPCETPRVSCIVVIHNASELIENKIQNSLALDYPQDHLDMFLCSDGSTDGTEELIRPFASERIHLKVYSEQRGKAAVINDIAAQCDGDLLLFSDVDATLAPDCLKMMVRHFFDDDIGGVSGSRMICETDGSPLIAPQKNYISADSVIKVLESRQGSTTSNDGKLYMIRRGLFRPISPTATDDLFACLNIVSQGKRFVFEPHACACIGKPSQGMMHEIQRRRRIVCRSLSGIWAMRTVLNPIRFKSFALGLFVNKVLRRAIPFFLIILLVSSLLLAFQYPFAWLLVGVQLFFYILAMVQIIATRFCIQLSPIVDKASAIAFYFCLGNVGTFLGVLDFVRGRRYEKWKPLKSDSRG